MNTPSRSFAGLNRIAGVALFLCLAAPQVLAQITDPPAIEWQVVGDNNPIDATLLFTASGPEYCSIFVSPTIRLHNSDLADCVLAQAFSLSSGTYVNQLKLGLFGSMGTTPPAATTYTLRITIASSLGGSPVLDLHELVPLPSSTGSSLTPTPPFSVSFPAIFLPKGTYYMVLSEDNPLPPGTVGALLWAANKVGSSEVGTLGSALGFCQGSVCQAGAGWQMLTVDPNQTSNLAGTNGTFAFELDGPLTLAPVGGGLGQIVRLIAVPITPMRMPIEAQLGFLDLNGNPIGPTSTVTLGRGQIQSLDLNLSQFVRQLGKHIEVVPVVAQPTNVSGAPSAASQLLVTTQIIDALTGFETVLTPALQPGSSAPALAPQVLAGGQTMRITVAATPPNPCNAALGFANEDGVALGPSEPVRVGPGTGTSLDLNANTVGLTLGRRIEVQPIVTPTATASPGEARAAVNSFCQVTVEVFDNLTGRTSASQSTLTALPAVQ
jgi:hypothetical protein